MSLFDDRLYTLDTRQTAVVIRPEDLCLRCDEATTALKERHGQLLYSPRALHLHFEHHSRGSRSFTDSSVVAEDQGASTSQVHSLGPCVYSSSLIEAEPVFT